MTSLGRFRASDTDWSASAQEIFWSWWYQEELGGHDPTAVRRASDLRTAKSWLEESNGVELSGVAFGCFRSQGERVQARGKTPAMTRITIRNEFDLDVYQEPSLIVTGDGAIRAFNRAANRALSRFDLASSLFDACMNLASTLRRYLLRCAGTGPPATMKLNFRGRNHAGEFLCLGSVWSARGATEGAASFLLRLFSFATTRT